MEWRKSCQISQSRSFQTLHTGWCGRNLKRSILICWSFSRRKSSNSDICNREGNRGSDRGGFCTVKKFRNTQFCPTASSYSTAIKPTMIARFTNLSPLTRPECRLCSSLVLFLLIFLHFQFQLYLIQSLLSVLYCTPTLCLLPLSLRADSLPSWTLTDSGRDFGF